VGLTEGGGGTATMACGDAPVTSAILASEADGPSQGWTGKAVTCLSAGAKKWSGVESGTTADALNALGHGATREKGGRVDSVPRGGRRGAEGEGSGAAPREPARHGRGGFRPLGQRRAVHIAQAPRARCEQGRRRVRATRGQRLTSGRDDAGAQWVVVGCRRARQRGAALTRGPGSTVPSDSVLNRFKFISNGFNLAQTLTDPNGVFPFSKNWK
jgi:hypothetical protein